MVNTKANKNNKALKIVKWKAKPNVTDSEISSAVNNMLLDLNKLPGFISQRLYKTEFDEWVDINYWETKEHAHESNSKMLKKKSFSRLINLIDVNSVNVEIMDEK